MKLQKMALSLPRPRRRSKYVPLHREVTRLTSSSLAQLMRKLHLLTSVMLWKRLLISLPRERLSSDHQSYKQA